jgi:transposase
MDVCILAQDGTVVFDRNLSPFGKKLAYAANRVELHIPERSGQPSVRRSAALDLALIDKLDELIAQVERYLTRTAKVDDVQTYHRLRTIPGVGPIPALVLRYEIHDLDRFERVGQFRSYCRLVRCDHEPAGKKPGWGGKKIGNAHLRWAFAEIACLFRRGSERARTGKQRQEKKHRVGRALAILATRLGRSAFPMTRKDQAFDEERFGSGQAGPAAPARAGAEAAAPTGEAR